MSDEKIQTRAIAGAGNDFPKQRPVALPIVQTTNFLIDDELNAAFDRGDYRTQYLYTRHSNPTVDALQRRLAELHTAEDSVCMASGMAAISAAFVGLTEPGDGVLADTVLYGATTTFLSKYLAAMGREVVFADFSDVDAVDSALARLARPRLVYGETFSNPLLRVLDLPRIAAQAHAVGALLAVDNTFANPTVCRPLEHSADIVISSLSKSVSGHSDVHGGLVCGKHEHVQQVWHAMIHLGSCLDPHAAYLIWRGLKTISMRTDTAAENALLICDALASHRGVERVYQPPVQDCPWLRHRGSMLAFVVQGGNKRAKALMNALRVMVPATSLGGVETLVSLPYNTSHRTRDAQEKVGLLPGTVRLSVGCEHPDDLIADLQQAMAATHA
ncbi:MAG: cystathionine beta-lyase/cystathionine gamma-synthase [Bradymonadia bacterium]|jgi:cystathionine beta-lyase/cystathionine gamma-synthase